MLIQELCAYASKKLSPPPPRYQESVVRYLIALRADGSMLPPIRDTSFGQGKEWRPGITLMVPEVIRTSAIRPQLLAGNAEYVLGIASKKNDDVKVRQRHAAFVEMVDQCSAATGEPTVAAVGKFLANLDRENLQLPKDFNPRATITFEVGSNLERPVDLPSVREFWAVTTGANEAGDPSDWLQCIGCGQLRPALARHHIKIQGVPGGEHEKVLVSANERAFVSYGLRESRIAPMCLPCVEAYGNALNKLLDDPGTSIKMKEGAYVFWTKKDAEFPISAFITNPDEAQVQVKSLLEAHYRGNEAAVDLDPNPFYALGLGANKARLIVRDWIETSVEEARRNLGRYFALQEMVESDGALGNAAPLYRLTGATVRNPHKEKAPPIVVRSLVRLALSGLPLPMDVLYLAVRRNRATRTVTRERAMLIKMVLLSQSSESEGKEKTMSEIDTANADPAYLCGRLLAVLNEIQYQAFKPNHPNTTIVDRYYGSASSTPGVVFGLLIRNAQPHLAKLRKKGQTGQASAAALDRRLQNLAIGIEDLPTTLTLQEQGLFALGFYHQRANDRRAAREHAEARGKADENEETSA